MAGVFSLARIASWASVVNTVGGTNTQGHVATAREGLDSILFMPVTRGINKASAQSTLFQLGSLSINEVC